MLVLSRKQNEAIQIGDSITITVLRMKGNAVRLGIEAPASLSVLRGELAERLKAQQASHEMVILHETPDQVAKPRVQHNAPQRPTQAELPWPTQWSQTHSPLETTADRSTGHPHAGMWST